jgi:phosphotransferase system IIA component
MDIKDIVEDSIFSQKIVGDSITIMWRLTVGQDSCSGMFSVVLALYSSLFHNFRASPTNAL